jgi:hypothetical protein
MTLIPKTPTSGPDLNKLRKLLGPAPVLSSESRKAYDAILSGLMEAVKPNDFVLEMLVTDLADWTWEIKRYKRYKVLLAESKRIEKERKAAKYGNPAKIDTLLAEAADEFEEFETLKSGIKYYEQLDDLLAIAIKRRDDTLALIELYRQGLGLRARQASDDIIEADFQETNAEAPAIAGPGDGAE